MPIIENPVRSLKTFLSSTEPFRLIPPSELERMTSVSREMKHAKGETIFSEGDEASSVWILLYGRLEVLRVLADGKQRIIEIIQPKDLFGTLCRIGGQGRTYPCTAVAAIESVSLRIPEKTFMDLFYRFPCVVSGVCSLCSTRLNMMRDLTCTSQEPVETRIVRTLIRLKNQHGNVLPYTKKQIGDLAATTVETTIRTLSKFQKKKWISSSRGEIILKDLPRLTSLLD